MEYIFFYLSIAGVLLILGICSFYKPLDFRSFVIAVTTIAYSLIYEIILGEYYGLYYYINQNNSIIYMVLAGILLYPSLNVIYVLFLPKQIKNTILYTFFWIIAMIIFEYGSLLFKTIVFTGWELIPWSIVTYLGTYLWIYLLYRYISNRKYSPKLFNY
ncbi:hypothetical protein RBH29_03875 [Herbivorax sp. ANBcel31]|uniref:hypothetical protein n=1 Tax=Herbivorax sp. ANBcel31 TaxID=3069754 RepID=UPI0027AEE895|nr:hypothetical protein [Herbivorax sp. ANBcel31]MDQ2085571.1 hypothetical protein [Herbivorax sp. ANBcel31]